MCETDQLAEVAELREEASRLNELLAQKRPLASVADQRLVAMANAVEAHEVLAEAAVRQRDAMSTLAGDLEAPTGAANTCFNPSPSLQ